MTAPTPAYRQDGEPASADAVTADVVTTPQVIEVLSYGEDGEYLVTNGHVDLKAFSKAAYAESCALHYDLTEEDMPDPEHRWMRPIQRSDCDTDEEFERKKADDWQLWADSAEGGAEPITLVRFDW